MEPPSPNAAQIEYWNGRAGQKWATLWTQLDRMLASVTAVLVDAAGDVRGKSVLDIGCGTGQLSALLAAQGASVTGIDISAPMLAVAKERSGDHVTFLERDAAAFRASDQFDLAISRFGVMFFDDPPAAFRMIHENVRPDGRLVFACWRTVAENEWVSVPMGAVRDLLPESPPPDPHAPGPFAFADDRRVHAILDAAGFRRIAIRPVDVPITIGEDGGVDSAVRFVLQIGPVGAALAESPDTVREAAAERLATALGRHAKPDGVVLKGAIWLVQAEA
ncbi:MAG: methyltransferase domain-containing protein [Hyphomicrobiales bacterium]